MKKGLVFSGLLFIFFYLISCNKDVPSSPQTESYEVTDRWASSENLEISINQQDTERISVTSIRKVSGLRLSSGEPDHDTDFAGCRPELSICQL